VIRDVNLHPPVGIPAGIAPFGPPGTEIFPLWGRRKKLPRRGHQAGIGEEAFVPTDSPKCKLFNFFIFENSIYLFRYILWDILVMSFVWLCIFCYTLCFFFVFSNILHTLWNVLAMRFCMIINSQMLLHCFFGYKCIVCCFYFLKKTWIFFFF
jgi:hypothetical protein